MSNRGPGAFEVSSKVLGPLSNDRREALVLQGELFPDLFQSPTVAMQRGDDVVCQCSWCGVLVASARAVELGVCPACRRDDATWWPQPVRVGPFLRPIGRGT